MNLFDKLVEQALERSDLTVTLQPVVEKELLHHDILREMSHAGLLTGLTFIGGTCLRACYNSPRMSEDLDFTGGADFTYASLHDLGTVLEQRLSTKYGLEVRVSDPVCDDTTVATWKIKVETRPESKNLPLQRINIDIYAIPSYDAKPAMLNNYYGVDMGTAGLILQAQSREEILADKYVAFAFRNRIKNRDLWDILWLQRQGVKIPVALLPDKLNDHRQRVDVFVAELEKRSRNLRQNDQLRQDFIFEMRRFLPINLVESTINNPDFWTVVVNHVQQGCDEIILAVRGDVPDTVDNRQAVFP